MENPEEQSSSSMPSNKSAVFSKRKGGRKKFQETRHPVYKGVRRRNGKWVCELWELNKKSRIWLGTFSSPEMAARAYDAAALASRGDSAALNFPEVACELPRARSDDIRDIKYAAMEAEVKSFSSSSSSCLSSSSSCMEISTSEKVQESSRKVFVDEEEVFNMPGILDSMAEALILTPLAMKNGFKWDDFEETEEFTLWSD